MSLQTRLDIAGALHYIILRGVEKFKSSWATKIGRHWSSAWPVIFAYKGEDICLVFNDL